ncbi:hypothetical protein DKX38_027135 [Salix brachista]|uniref:Protein SPIRAL1-like 1 n=1 Tax=Salix brachista TaxID=2182728 RepID=A0A5N5JN52_9ROSI|nr:hypothetical protein DKX38_027135 [Salix brachista]
MGRGVGAGGGQSSSGYLFGGGEPANNSPVARYVGHTASISPSPKPASASPPLISRLQLEFMEIDRPSTKVHAAPGGGSSLGYLLGSIRCLLLSTSSFRLGYLISLSKNYGLNHCAT